MVLLGHTFTIEIKEWVSCYELMRTNYIEKKNHAHNYATYKKWH